MIQNGQPFVGGLFAPRWPERAARIDWRALPDIEATEVESGATGWQSLILRTDQPLSRAGERARERGRYSYPFLVRQSGPRFLLASSATEALDQLRKVGKVGHRTLSPRVDVARLVTEIAQRPAGYVLGAVFARADGYGHSLRTMAFYGADLADAKLFRDVLPKLVPFRATLRTHRTRQDVLTVGSQGEVSFFYRGKRGLQEVDDALRYIAMSGYMNWSLDE